MSLRLFPYLFPVAWAAGLILAAAYFAAGRWKTKGVVKPEAVEPS